MSRRRSRPAPFTPRQPEAPASRRKRVAVVDPSRGLARLDVSEAVLRVLRGYLARARVLALLLAGASLSARGANTSGAGEPDAGAWRPIELTRAGDGLPALAGDGSHVAYLSGDEGDYDDSAPLSFVLFDLDRGRPALQLDIHPEELRPRPTPDAETASALHRANELLRSGRFAPLPAAQWVELKQDAGPSQWSLRLGALEVRQKGREVWLGRRLMGKLPPQPLSGACLGDIEVQPHRVFQVVPGMTGAWSLPKDRALIVRHQASGPRDGCEGRRNFEVLLRRKPSSPSDR